MKRRLNNLAIYLEFQSQLSYFTYYDMKVIRDYCDLLGFTKYFILELIVASAYRTKQSIIIIASEVAYSIVPPKCN